MHLNIHVHVYMKTDSRPYTRGYDTHIHAHKNTLVKIVQGSTQVIFIYTDVHIYRNKCIFVYLSDIHSLINPVDMHV